MDAYGYLNEYHEPDFADTATESVPQWFKSRPEDITDLFWIHFKEGYFDPDQPEIDSGSAFHQLQRTISDVEGVYRAVWAVEETTRSSVAFMIGKGSLASNRCVHPY